MQQLDKHLLHQTFNWISFLFTIAEVLLSIISVILLIKTIANEQLHTLERKYVFLLGYNIGCQNPNGHLYLYIFLFAVQIGSFKNLQCTKHVKNVFWYILLLYW